MFLLVKCPRRASAVRLCRFGMSKQVKYYEYVSGLSPARQGWNSRSGRLNNEDAQYVEVIHTDSNGVLGHGLNEAIGHVDFFVNGGSRQPGCFLNNRCNHEYSWKIFALSIVQNIFGNHCRNRLQVRLNTCRRGDALIMGNIQLNKKGYVESLIYYKYY